MIVSEIFFLRENRLELMVYENSPDQKHAIVFVFYFILFLFFCLI